MSSSIKLKVGEWVKISNSKQAIWWEFLGLKTHIPQIKGKEEILIRSAAKIVRTVHIYKITATKSK